MSTPEDQVPLLQENAALKTKLEDYKRLEEDLIAKRVFEKARGYLITWITFGGIALTVAGYVGYQSVIGYFKEVGKKKIDAFSEEQIKTIVATSINIRVDQGVDRAMPEISERVYKRVTQRSEPLSGFEPAASSPLPTAQPEKSLVDWTADMAPPRNSGAEGSVVGLALAATLEFYVFKTTGSHVAISARDIYNEVRANRQALSVDGGAFIKDGIEFLEITGVVEERAWPYRSGEYNLPPPPNLAAAKRYRITEAKRLVTLVDMRRALNSGPAIAGIAVYDSTLLTPTGGIVHMPRPKEQVIGGHAICIVGYDDTKKLLKFQNSWGASWGDHGYGYLPYDYFREQSSDCWTFRYAGD
jgi:hypothetical protein